jgi:hypothetical protein
MQYAHLECAGQRSRRGRLERERRRAALGERAAGAGRPVEAVPPRQLELAGSHRLHASGSRAPGGSGRFNAMLKLGSTAALSNESRPWVI